MHSTQPANGETKQGVCPTVKRDPSLTMQVRVLVFDVHGSALLGGKQKPASAAFKAAMKLINFQQGEMGLKITDGLNYPVIVLNLLLLRLNDHGRSCLHDPGTKLFSLISEEGKGIKCSLLQHLCVGNAMFENPKNLTKMNAKGGDNLVVPCLSDADRKQAVAQGGPNAGLVNSEAVCFAELAGGAQDGGKRLKLFVSFLNAVLDSLSFELPVRELYAKVGELLDDGYAHLRAANTKAEALIVLMPLGVSLKCLLLSRTRQGKKTG